MVGGETNAHKLSSDFTRAPGVHMYHRDHTPKITIEKITLVVSRSASEPFSSWSLKAGDHYNLGKLGHRCAGVILTDLRSALSRTRLGRKAAENGRHHTCTGYNAYLNTNKKRVKRRPAQVQLTGYRRGPGR